jgi:hypothetical protein
VADYLGLFGLLADLGYTLTRLDPNDPQTEADAVAGKLVLYRDITARGLKMIAKAFTS